MADEEIHAPRLGDEGEPCARCGTPLAEDQRYCLNCGRRRTEARLAFLDVLRQQALADAPARREIEVTEPAEERKGISPATAIVGGIAIVLILAMGILTGGLIAGDDQQQAAAPQQPQVLNLGGGGAGGAQTASASGFKGDWPEGKEGWTVQVKLLPKETTQTPAIDQAKTEVSGKGAPDVGALDTDQYTTLEAGNYMVYSGVFDDEKAAKKALDGVKKDFKDAKVVQVGGAGGATAAASGGDKDIYSGKDSGTIDRSQLEALSKLSPEEYQKRSRRLPNTTKLPGKPPPKDNKDPGGGTKGETIE